MYKFICNKNEKTNFEVTADSVVCYSESNSCERYRTFKKSAISNVIYTNKTHDYRLAGILLVILFSAVVTFIALVLGKRIPEVSFNTMLYISIPAVAFILLSSIGLLFSQKKFHLMFKNSEGKILYNLPLESEFKLEEARKIDVLAADIFGNKKTMVRDLDSFDKLVNGEVSTEALEKVGML